MQRSSPLVSTGLMRFDGVQRRRRDAAPGADHGVDLVDEQEWRPAASSDSPITLLRPLLEIAAIFRAGDQRAHVERVDSAVRQHAGNLAFGRSCARGPSAMRRFSYAGFA